MHLSFHGGMCCGVKHIYEMGTNPEALNYSFEAVNTCNADINYTYTMQDKRLYPNAAPNETGIERLDRYLAWLKEYRPSGIVEIILTCEGFLGPYTDQSKWVPILEERGFKKVTPEGGVYNSNSGNQITIFHLIMAEGDAPDEDDEDDVCCDDDDCDCH